jgi:hypothetical protein
MFFCNGSSRSFVFAANRLQDRIDPRRDPAFVIAVPKMRFDFVFGNVERGDVGQRPLQAVANLDKHLAVLNEHKKDRAIAPLLLTDSPRLGYPLRVICNVRVALHLRKDRDHHLIGSFALELGQLLVKTMSGFL